MCHMSHVMSHMSHVTWIMSHSLPPPKKKVKLFTMVCSQRGLPRLFYECSHRRFIILTLNMTMYSLFAIYGGFAIIIPWPQITCSSNPICMMEGELVWGNFSFAICKNRVNGLFSSAHEPKTKDKIPSLCYSSYISKYLHCSLISVSLFGMK